MKLLEIERLRCFAVLMVINQHLSKLKPEMHPWLNQGGPGVDLFFVISGFVVTRSLVRYLPTFSEGMSPLERINTARPALLGFMLRRIYRILPMAILWCVLPLVCSVWLNESGAFGKTDQLLRETFAVLTLQYNYAYAYGNGNKLGHYWSLAVEEHFYLMLPLVMVLCATAGRRMLALVVGILAVACVLRPFVEFDGPKEWWWAYRGFVTHRKLDALCAGALLSLMRDQGWFASLGTFSRAWAGFLGWFCLLCIFVIQGIIPSGQFFQSGQVVLWLLAAIVVLLASFDRGVVMQVPVLSRVWEWLGARSYGMYLTHMPSMWLLQEVDTRLKGTSHTWFHEAYSDPWLWAAGVLVVCILLSDVCYRLVERPLIRRGHQKVSALAAPPAPGVP